MRLKSEQVDVFIRVLDSYVNGSGSQLYLYGSRSQDHLKGGDIDILLIVSEEKLLKQIQNLKIKILTLFKKELGERRIDFLISSHDRLTRDPFLNEALKTAILLKEWQK